MPTDTLWIIVAVLAMFGFFTFAVVCADATWKPRQRSSSPLPGPRGRAIEPK